MRNIAAAIASLCISGNVLAQGFYVDPTPVGSWTYHSHKGSFSISLKAGGECFVTASTEPDGGAAFIPCAWRVENGYIMLMRAGYRRSDDGGYELNPLSNRPVLLQYDPKHDLMQLLGGPEAWLRRDLGRPPRMVP